VDVAEETQETPQAPEQPTEEEQPQPEVPTEEQPAEDDVHPTPEEPGPMSERELEQGIEKLTKEATRHANRVSEIMGDDAQLLVPCELCAPGIPGFRWPEAPTEEQRQAVLLAIGEAAPADLVEDPDAEQCDRCHGLGELLTGSKVETQRTRACTKCGANGWTTPEQRQAYDSTQQAKAVAAEVVPLREGQASQPTEVPSVDAWGRVVGQEFFGMNPVYMTPDQRARDSARPQ
jgi:predicted  nucleic acid-binding Zn-ribbon protein